MRWSPPDAEAAPNLRELSCLCAALSSETDTDDQHRPVLCMYTGQTETASGDPSTPTNYFLSCLPSRCSEIEASWAMGSPFHTPCAWNPLPG
jgi:hypothetical protein